MTRKFETNFSALTCVRQRWVKLLLLAAVMPLAAHWGVQLEPVMTPAHGLAFLVAGAAGLYLLWSGLDDRG